MQAHLIHLFKYNEWATRETAHSIEKLVEDKKLASLLSHIIAAQELWLNRVLQKDIYVSPWTEYTIEKCVEASTSLTRKWINLLESCDDTKLRERIDYTNTKGKKHNNNIKDIAIHIINHSSYHRGQIAQLVREKGGSPAYTDYIHYQRTL